MKIIYNAHTPEGKEYKVSNAAKIAGAASFALYEGFKLPKIFAEDSFVRNMSQTCLKYKQSESLYKTLSGATCIGIWALCGFAAGTVVDYYINTFNKRVAQNSPQIKK